MKTTAVRILRTRLPVFTIYVLCAEGKYLCPTVTQNPV